MKPIQDREALQSSLNAFCCLQLLCQEGGSRPTSLKYSRKLNRLDDIVLFTVADKEPSLSASLSFSAFPTLLVTSLTCCRGHSLFAYGETARRIPGVFWTWCLWRRHQLMLKSLVCEVTFKVSCVAKEKQFIFRDLNQKSSFESPEPRHSLSAPLVFVFFFFEL